MKIIIFFLLIGMSFVLACNSGNKKNTEAVPEENVRKVIPYTSLLKEQIQYVDSTPLIIYKYVPKKNSTDTSFIDRPEFHRLAKEFLEPDITSDGLKKKYTINSFGDQTTGLLVFSYETIDSSLPVKLVNLRFKPAPDNARFTSLDITKSERRLDTLFIKKLFWKSNHFFHIITTGFLRDSIVTEKKEVITWNTEPAEPEVDNFAPAKK